MSRLLVVGAGGHGRIVADAALESECWSAIAFFDNKYPELKNVDGWPVIGKSSQLPNHQKRPHEALIVAIGDAGSRLEWASIAKANGFALATVIHPRAVVSRGASIAEGSVVLANAVVNTGAEAAMATIINSNATVEHDCQLRDGVHVCPATALAGNVMIGARSWIGIGSAIRQGIRIGKDVMVGAGSVVVRDLPDNVVAYGVPAKIQR
jgi:sugar O-acyltransferase (sialic acid O-acetyltransferase NeuD family)